LCGSKGFSYKFELYTGQENQDKYRLIDEPDLMASANAVVRLSRITPENNNYRLYFDNYYTTIPLISYMASKGIQTLGTVRRNRLPNCKFPSDKILNKQPRGTAYEYITVFNDTPITSVVWKDNKIVSLLERIQPIDTINRFDKKSKRVIKIDCPNIIKEYNRHMGGVDLLDSLIGRYKIKMRSKKWYIRIWYHLIDVAIVNAWILYRRVEMEHGRKATISLFDFRVEVATSLTKVGEVITPKRGRPSSASSSQLLEKEIELKRKKPHHNTMPPKNVRLDLTDHWPTFTQTRFRCKLPGCGKLSYCICTKCRNHFCCNANRNCRL
jgi:hypothetical protein